MAREEKNRSPSVVALASPAHHSRDHHEQEEPAGEPMVATHAPRVT
jgi:hypothetical protein